MIKVEFIKDFATKKKGDSMEVDSMLAHTLIKVDKVAVIHGEKKAKKSKKSNGNTDK